MQLKGENLLRGTNIICIPLEYCAPPVSEEAKVSDLLQNLGIE